MKHEYWNGMRSTFFLGDRIFQANPWLFQPSARPPMSVSARASKPRPLRPLVAPTESSHGRWAAEREQREFFREPFDRRFVFRPHADAQHHFGNIRRRLSSWPLMNAVDANELREDFIEFQPQRVEIVDPAFHFPPRSGPAASLVISLEIISSPALKTRVTFIS